LVAGLRKTVGRVTWGAVWGVTLLLTLVMLLRLAWHDGTWVLQILNGFTPYIFAPTWAVAAAAALARRWRLAALAGILATAHAHWVLIPALPQTSAPTMGRLFKVVSANLLVVNETPEILAAELSDLDADIYCLQELSARWDAELERRGFWARYPFNKRVTGENPFGSAIASRIPLRDLEVVALAELPQLRGVLTLDGREIAILNVHLLAPQSPEDLPDFRSGAARLLREVEALGPRTFIIAGDFNATPDSDFAARMRALADDGWEVAGRGFGFGFTWPNSVFPLPSMRLDHLFVSRDLTISHMAIGVGTGSDHRPLVSTIARRQR
jgi:endonuclease/exonuclease/phosphatase (EEP) superfamily protein YafD